MKKIDKYNLIILKSIDVYIHNSSIGSKNPIIGIQ